MFSYIVVTAVGNDRPGIVNQLTKTVLEHDCNIEDSRMTILGGEFAIIMMLSGHWNAIAKIEDALPRLEESLGLTIICRRTEMRTAQPTMLSYQVEALALDNPGIVHRLTKFFSSRNINIQDLNTSSYAAAHTGTPMFSLSMTINIPTTLSIAQLREQFLDFCDDLNLDGVIEPTRV